MNRDAGPPNHGFAPEDLGANIDPIDHWRREGLPPANTFPPSSSSPSVTPSTDFPAQAKFLLALRLQVPGHGANVGLRVEDAPVAARETSGKRDRSAWSRRSR
jgi:hypothetical protein